MYSGIIKIESNQSFTDGISLSDRATTTIKDQVQQFESSIDHLRKVMEGQRKHHNELFLSLKKLEELNSTNYRKISDSIDLGLEGLSLKMEREGHSEDKELSYLELQNNMLMEEQKNFQEVLTMWTGRVKGLCDSVGV